MQETQARIMRRKKPSRRGRSCCTTKQIRTTTKNWVDWQNVIIVYTDFGFRFDFVFEFKFQIRICISICSLCSSCLCMCVCVQQNLASFKCKWAALDELGGRSRCGACCDLANSVFVLCLALCLLQITNKPVSTFHAKAVAVSPLCSPLLFPGLLDVTWTDPSRMQIAILARNMQEIQRVLDFRSCLFEFCWKV